jgi:phosphoribosyl-AMP cyclohydrolase
MNINELPAWQQPVKWTQDGLIPAIAQDYLTGEILMMAWMNAQSLQLTVEENRAIYWSRSRNCLWRKGETSGNVQILHEMRLDCDNDVILLKVEQLGDIACHTGRRSCFYKRLDRSEAPINETTANKTITKKTQYQWRDIDPVLKNPKEMYSE